MSREGRRRTRGARRGIEVESKQGRRQRKGRRQRAGERVGTGGGDFLGCVETSKGTTGKARWPPPPPPRFVWNRSEHKRRVFFSQQKQQVKESVGISSCFGVALARGFGLVGSTAEMPAFIRHRVGVEGNGWVGWRAGGRHYMPKTKTKRVRISAARAAGGIRLS
jgi:hypothetical protein